MENQNTNMSNTLIYHLVALTVVMIWGGTFVNTRFLVDGGLKPEDVFLLRFLMGYICIWSVSPKKLMCDSWKDEALMLLLGVFGGSIYFLTENYAIKYARVNDVSFIVCTTPLLLAIFGLAFMKSVKASYSLIIGSIMAIIGMVFVIYSGSSAEDKPLGLLGDALALASAISWGVYSLVLKNVSDRYSTIFITRKVFFYGVLTILPVYCFSEWTFPLKGFLEFQIWGNLLFLGVLGSFGCFFAWNWALSKLGALKISNYIYLTPVSTVIVSAIFLKEPMTMMAYLGSALILLGVYVADKAK